MAKDPVERQRKIEEKVSRKAAKVRAKLEQKTISLAKKTARRVRKPSGINGAGHSGAALKSLLDYGREQIDQNIRLQLILAFALCLMVSVIVFNYALGQFGRLDTRKYFDYTQSMQTIETRGDRIATEIEKDLSGLSGNTLSETLNRRVKKDSDTARYSLIDVQGKVLASNESKAPARYDLFTLVKESQKKVATDQDPGYYTRLVPVQGTVRDWLIYRDMPQGELKHRNAGNWAIFIGIVEAMAAFVLMFYILTKQKVEYIQKLSRGIRIIARGNLNYQVEEHGQDELFQLATAINHMSRSLQSQIESERAAEKSKQELITNVSHDLRTPLTSVLGYLRLVLDHRFDSSEQMEEYLQIAYHKSEGLKSLIDDLFEYTKLSQVHIRSEQRPIAINELVEQMLEEYYPVHDTEGIQLVRQLPDHDLVVEADPAKLHRAFENLLANAVKYSDRPGTITVFLQDAGGGVRFAMTNPAAGLESENLTKLFDRFYRVEGSRSSETGGSGLGLAIARGIVEAHQGRITVEYVNGFITFVVWIPYRQH